MNKNNFYILLIQLSGHLLKIPMILVAGLNWIKSTPIKLNADKSIIILGRSIARFQLGITFLIKASPLEKKMIERTSKKSKQFGMIVREIVGENRESCGDIIFYILVNRTEQQVDIYDQNNKLFSQEIKLNYEGIVIPCNCYEQNETYSRINFAAFVKPLKNDISLTNGNLIIRNYDLHGYRIGTCIFNDIVTWAKQWPDADIRKIGVSPVDASTDETRERRNKFYEQFALNFDYCPERRSGSSKPMKAGDLTNTFEWKKNIEMLPINEMTGSIVKDKLNFEYREKQQSLEIQRLRKSIKEIENSPFIHALNVYLRLSIKIMIEQSPKLFFVTILLVTYLGLKDLYETFF